MDRCADNLGSIARACSIIRAQSNALLPILLPKISATSYNTTTMESSPPSYGSPAASGSLKDPPHKILKVYENIFFNLRQVYFLYSTLHFGEFSRGHGKNNLVLWLAKAIRHFNWLRCELLGLRTNVKQVKPENKKEVRRALAGAAKALGMCSTCSDSTL